MHKAVFDDRGQYANDKERLLLAASCFGKKTQQLSPSLILKPMVGGLQISDMPCLRVELGFFTMAQGTLSSTMSGASSAPTLYVKIALDLDALLEQALPQGEMRECQIDSYMYIIA